MPKNIVLCSDGTGNRDIKGRGTNVFKLFEAVDLNGHRTDPRLETQLAFYDDGVGTGGTVLRRIAGGAVGLGLKEKVKELYRELSRVYDDGDRIFLFGFSRGAFTVRTLAGMIGACGVLKGESFETARALRAAVDEAYDLYRQSYRNQIKARLGRILTRPAHDAARNGFREHQVHTGVRIAFIGVWDTVDAVGMPFATAEFINRRVYQFKFPTRELGGHVDRAAHALSVDDQRLSFEPVLWKGPDPRIEQVWFSGVHSNVGGGYPKQGMSLVALDWMLGLAEERGLRLLQFDRELFRGHACVDDLLYNSRSGLGLFYRWAPRDIRRYCLDSGIEPRIHLSVAERIAHATDDYAPGNIPPQVRVVPSPVGENEPDFEQKRKALQHRATRVQATLRKAIGNRYLLDDAEPFIRIGRRSYLLFVLSGLGLVVTLGLGAAQLLRAPLPAWLMPTAGAATTLSSLRAAILNHRADDGMSDLFSSFWQKHQKDIRESLKQAKSESRDLVAS